MGGNFTRVERRDGTLIDEVSNVAVFDLSTGAYLDIAPKLGAGSDTSNVRDIAAYGNAVVIGGDFAGPTSKQRNLVAVDATTGGILRWYNAQRLQSVLAAPDLGMVYAGGVSLSAFDFEGGSKLWVRAKTTVDQTLRTHHLQPGYRDLERDGQTIWAACGCDWVNDDPAKALVKLDTEGNHDASWVAQRGPGALASRLRKPPTTSTWARGATTSWPSTRKPIRERVPGCATPRDLRRQWRSWTGSWLSVGTSWR